MIDREYRISHGTLIGCILWGAVFAVLAAAWFVGIFIHGLDSDEALNLLGYTTCVIAAYAVAWHIRRYVVRLADLVRYAHGLDRGDDGSVRELQSVRGVPTA